MIGRNFADNGLPEDEVAAGAQRVYALAAGLKPSQVAALRLTDGWRHAAATVIAYSRLGQPVSLAVDRLAAEVHRAFCRGDGRTPPDFEKLPADHRRAWAAAARYAAWLTLAHPEQLLDVEDRAAVELAAAGRTKPRGTDK